MAHYTAKMPIKEGEVVQFDDGPRHHVVERGSFSDQLVVETEGERTERHIDWFYERAAEADDVHVSVAET